MAFFWEVILLFVVLFLWIFYSYLTNNYNYWEKRKVPYKKPEFPFGSMKKRISSSLVDYLDDVYNEFPNERFCGIIEFRTPTLVVKDPELINKILVKDFKHFMNRAWLYNPNEYISRHLFNVKELEWKDLRKKLNPTFNSAEVKPMFQVLKKCGEQLKLQIESNMQNENCIDFKNMFQRFSLAIVGSFAFGLETVSMYDTNSDFMRIFGGTLKPNLFRFFRRIILSYFPGLVETLNIQLLNPELEPFTRSLIKDTIEYRKEKNITRNDFLHLLMNVNQNKSSGEENEHVKDGTSQLSEGFTIEQMTAQIFSFFVAGSDPPSSLAAFCLFELARHSEIQEKLYNNIAEAVDRNGGELSQDLLSKIPYLDQVINETVRLYGACITLLRECTRPYKVPDSDLTIEKGMKIIIPLYSLHHDARYWPDPYTFDPERFSYEEVKKRQPNVFLPFGKGPRNCIGTLFGKLEVKVGIITVISNFKMELSPDQEVPIEIAKKATSLMPEKKVLLKLTRRSCSPSLNEKMNF